jgi:AraC-like DNA-binding protein
MNKEVIMRHVPLLALSSPDTVLEFSHFDYDASAGEWKKENIIIRSCIKINVFEEGAFSVFSDGLLHRPICGDICVFPPMKMHYGQIKEPMHVRYYQLDIGVKAFSGTPGGDQLIQGLLNAVAHKDSFLRPDREGGRSALSLCKAIRDAIEKGVLYLAYAKVIELLDLLCSLFLRATGSQGVSFSLRTAQAVQLIEKSYATSMTVEQIAKAIGVSPSFLSRIFKKELGIGVHEYQSRYRILKSVEFLKEHSITDAAYLCGFCDTSHFISVFKKHLNMTPAQYKSLKL